MRLSRFIILMLLVFSAISCKGNPDEDKKGETTKVVVDKYVETLKTSPEKARQAGEAVEERTQRQEDLAEETQE